MKLKLTVNQLVGAGASCGGLGEFKRLFGEYVEVEWTREKQIEVLKGPLGPHVGWAYHKGLIPSWSLSGADLTRADLSEANLTRANLTRAKICSCNDSPCASTREKLSAAGWVSAPDGLLSPTTH